MLHTFYELYYTKNEKYIKNVIVIMFFYVFPIFHVAWFIESMQHGYSLDEELNFASNEYSTRNLSKNFGR